MMLPMKTMLGWGLCLTFGLLFGGCQASSRESKKYAELRTGDGGRVQVVIVADQWGGIFTVHGFGPGNVKNLHYWTTLSGPGPTYVNPALNMNSNTQFKHVGTITVDRMKKQVIIDLNRIISKSPDAEKLEPSPANGTYPIERITNEPFIPD